MRMSEQQHIRKCNQCNGELSGEFCPHCGRPKTLDRINGRFILSEMASVLNFQKGILFTIKELLIRPGVNVRRFIHQDRNRLVKPISFIIVCSLIYIIAQRTLQFDDGYMNYSNLDWGDSAITRIMNWISNNYGIANILMALFIAFWTKLFFRKYGYNIFEILILLYFLLGVQMLMFTVLGIAGSISGLSVLDTGSGIGIIYVCWAIARFFDGRKMINYLKGLLSYMLGMISFVFIAMVCGLLIDLITK